MSRGFGECCHYDDGYDDGYDEGRREAKVEVSRDDVANALRLLARERLLYGRDDEAVLLEACADEVARDTDFEHRVECEKQREAQIVKAYADARAVAA